MKTGKNILQRFQKRWQLLLWLEIFLYAFGAGIFVVFLTQTYLFGLAFFILVVIIALLFIRPWDIKLKDVHSYIDRELPAMEYSSQLLLQNREDLSPLAQLQQKKVILELEKNIRKIKPENNLLRAGVIAVFLVFFGFLGFKLGWMEDVDFKQSGKENEDGIVLRPADSIAAITPPPILESQKVSLQYPSYTGLRAVTTSKMDIEAVEGTRVKWEIAFDSKIDSARMESMGRNYKMNYSNGAYSGSSSLKASGFYNFRFFDTSGAAYVTDLYSIKVIRDKAPVIEIPGMQQFTSFEYNDNKVVEFSAIISDDFGIANVQIIATVSKGTGESVKFREEQLNFDSPVKRGSKKLELKKRIDLDQMKMEVGDELYFYVEAIDLKQPRANRARSETYFAVIKDTISYGAGVEGTLGVDLMPDYFRSQRQLIIDTEKLISNRKKIPQKEFNSTSNDLGFDQKALRLRYGQFMGDESEGGIEAGGNNEISGEEEEDPLAEFIHDHDGDNEHNLVAPAPEEYDEEEAGNETPIDKFLHDHGDPESATLFTDNLRNKLRQALDIMWDAELHLRLYEPEKSLPYQYKALALIQEIKNSARIYVHRIGYDPPPIKEEVRLTGKIEDVSNYQKKADLKKPESDPYMREAIHQLEELITQKLPVSAENKRIFELAGNELAEKAIEAPGKYLQTLQELKWITEARDIPKELLQKVQRGLLDAVSQPAATPGKGKKYRGVINKLFLKELEKND